MGNCPTAGFAAGLGPCGDFNAVGSTGVLTDRSLPVGEIIVLDAGHNGEPVGITHGTQHGEGCGDFIITKVTDPLRQQNTHMIIDIAGGIQNQFAVGHIEICTVRHFNGSVVLKCIGFKIVKIQEILGILGIFYQKVDGFAALTVGSNQRIYTVLRGGDAAVFDVQCICCPSQVRGSENSFFVIGNTVEGQHDRVAHICGNGGSRERDGCLSNVFGGLHCTAGATNTLETLLADGAAVCEPFAKEVTIGTVFCGFLLRTAGGAGAVFVGVFQAQQVKLVGVVGGPHGDADGCGTGGGGQAAVFGKFRINPVGTHGFQNLFRTKPGDPDAVHGAAVISGSAKGSGIEPVAGIHGDGDGEDLAGGVDTPAGDGVILTVVFQNGPEVGAGAEIFGELPKIGGIFGDALACGGDDQRAGDGADGDGTAGIAGGGDVLSAHGDGHGEVFTGDIGAEGLSVGDALDVSAGAGCAGEGMGDGMDGVLAGFQTAVFQQRFDGGGTDQVHAVLAGMDAVRQVCGGDAAFAQVHIGHIIVLTDGGEDCVALGQLFAGIVAGGVGGQQAQDLGLGVKMLQAQEGMHISVRQIIPLLRGQVRCGGGGGGIERADPGHMGQIVGAAVEQNHIGGAVAAQVFDPGQIAHGGVLAGGAGGDGGGTAASGPAPAVVDTQSGTQSIDDLHPPGFLDLGQQVVLGIPGQMLQVEAVRHGDVPGKGGNAVAKDGDDLSLKSFQIGVRRTAAGAGAVFVGVGVRILLFKSAVDADIPIVELMRMAFSGHINPKCGTNVLFSHIRQNGRTDFGNVEGTDGVVSPPFLRYDRITAGHIALAGGLYRVSDPAFGAVLPAVREHDDGANGQRFPGKTQGCKVFVTAFCVCDNDIVISGLGGVPIAMPGQLRFQFQIMLPGNFAGEVGLGNSKGLRIGVVDGFNGNCLLLRSHLFGGVGDGVDIITGDGFDEHQRGEVSAEGIGHVIAVPCDGITQQRGSGVLHGRSIWNDKVKIVVCQNLVLYGRYDGIVHGHLIIVVLGERADGGILLVGPGHVPHQLCAGARPHISNQLFQIRAIAAFYAAQRTALLQGNIIPAP